MMTKAQLRRFIFDVALLIVLSVVFISFGMWFSGRTEYKRIQITYQQNFSEVLAADHYSELNNYLVNESTEVSNVYMAYDANNAITGYIVDVCVENDSGEQFHALIGITYDGAKLTGVTRVDDEENPVAFTSDELQSISSQLLNAQIPVALNSQAGSDEQITDEYASVSGLSDGVFYAQALQKDEDGYIDYVELEVTNGRITGVQWDAFNTDSTTENRSDASLTGAYSVSGELWATQSFNICHALIEMQNPGKLAMKSDGTTGIVEGVTCDISKFVSLSTECIQASENGFTSEKYVAQLESLIEEESGNEASEYQNEEGYDVYSFDDLTLFEYDLPEDINSDDSDNEEQAYDEVNHMTVYETTLPRPVYAPDSNNSSSTTDTSNDGASGENSQSQDDVNGAEDGVANSISNALTDSVDGLPLSEIRTYIDGIPGHAGQQASSVAVSAVNTAYKFLKEYLNWLA